MGKWRLSSLATNLGKWGLSGFDDDGVDLVEVLAYEGRDGVTACQHALPLTRKDVADLQQHVVRQNIPGEDRILI